jgi:hypothetical protein
MTPTDLYKFLLAEQAGKRTTQLSFGVSWIVSKKHWAKI